MSKRNKTGKIAAIIAAVIIPVIALLVISFVFKNKSGGNGFSIVKYSLINVEGVNGRGEVEVMLDTVGIYEGFRSLNSKENVSDKKYEEFVNSISFQTDFSKNLHNGDDIMITAKWDEEAAKAAGINVTGSTRKYTVSNLADGVKVNLFADVELRMVGISPFIEIACENNSTNEYISQLEFSCDKSSPVAVGDEIIVSCDADAKEAAKYGYYFDNITMRYIVENADRYVSHESEIDRTIIDRIATEAIAVIGEITADTTSHITYTITGNREFLYRDGNEEAVDFSVNKILLANSTAKYKNKHQNYILVYVKGQIRIPDYSGSEDPYQYMDAYFCFVYSDAYITREGIFIMATDGIKDRYLCAESMEALQKEVKYLLGSEFEYVDVII